DVAHEEAVDEEVARAAHARRAVDELGDERAIALRQVATSEEGGHDEVGVCALGVDADQRVEGDPARRCHEPRRSPGATRAPRSHAPASMLGLPSGWTSSRSSAPPSPVATRVPSSSPGSPVAPSPTTRARWTL